jgi:AraC-like DNA-binding protein
MRPLLERHAILNSRDFDKARSFLSTRAIGLELAGAAKAVHGFEVHYNGVYFPGMWLGYIRYGAAVTARVSPQRHDYWIHLPLHGAMECSQRGRRVQCDRRRGMISSPSEVNVVRSDSGAARLSVAIRGDALERHLSLLLGDAPQVPLAFDAEIGLEAGYGRSLAVMLRCAAAELARDGWLGDPLIASRYEDFVMTGLLLSQPNNYSQALHRRARPLTPRDVRRAVEYIHDHIAEPISLSDLVREGGVAGRTLLKHFRDFKGVSPMRYMRNLRLLRVREALQSGSVHRVSEAVSRWGFAHAGRFSSEYRRRFGESPSRTLAKAKSG